MTWPSTAVATGDLITAAQLNLLPIRISDTTVAGASVASIDITSISQSFAHLLLHIYGRGATAAASTGMNVRANGDSGSNYDVQKVTGIAAAASAAESLATTAITVGTFPAASAAANIFAGGVVLLLNYGNAANQKCGMTFLAGKIGTSTGNLEARFNSWFWRSNAAINQITVSAGTGNLDIGTRVTLYGLA